MKKSIGNKTIVYPNPVFVIGSYDEKGVPNIMTASWGGICCSEPPSIAVSIRKQRHTYNNIILNQAFTVNIPSTKNVNEADYAGVYSGSKVNKFEELNLTACKSNLVNAPYIHEFPMVLICKLSNTLEIGTHTQFIGEILDVLVDEDALESNGLPSAEKIDSIIYDNATHEYYSFGKMIFKRGQGKSVKKL